MNNYDGSYDFIIVCDTMTYDELISKGLTLVADKKLNYSLNG